jgi:FtsH-binding integral membrane protein
MTSQDPGFGWQTATARVDRALFDEGLRRHMLSVYNYMAMGLVLTGIVAYVVGTTPALYVPIFTTPLKWVVMLAPLAFVLFFSFRLERMSAGTAQLVFWAFCATMGLSLASIFLVFTGTSIARTFFITAAMFGATSLYGYTTKRDLSQFGSFLIMGLIGVLPAVRRLGGRRPRVRRAHGLGHAVDQGAVRREHRRGIEAEARGVRGAFALPELHQHLPAPAQPDGRARVARRRPAS